MRPYPRLAMLLVAALSLCGCALLPPLAAAPTPTTAPTLAPATMAPLPTATPRPTSMPPTVAPPTVALPTVVLPTVAPPTAAPPTVAPAIPAPDVPPPGQVLHTTEEFALALPARWKAVELDEGSFDYFLDSLAEENPELAGWAEGALDVETLAAMYQFYAMDSELAGRGYASANVLSQALPLPFGSEALCVSLPDAYAEMGLELVDATCGLEINGLDVARFTVRMPAATANTLQYQYAYLQERTMWMLTLAVVEDAWPDYEATFVEIAESFRLLD